MNVYPNYGQKSNQQILMPQPNFPPLNNPQMMAPQQNYGPMNNPPDFLPPENNMYPAPNFPGMQFVYVLDPLTELTNCTGVEIKQQPEFFEMITGCETSNRYHVFGQSPQGFKYLFKCNEKSGFFMRNCCPSNMRQFDMNIVHITSGNPGAPELSKNFARLFKPFMCTIFCLCRPEMHVTLIDGNKQIGYIRHICTLCDPEFHIYDEKGQIKYIVSADCCQCGLLCANNFFGKLSEVRFNIYVPGNHQAIGYIWKKPANLSEMVTDADSYQVNFPQVATPNDKLVIIALALMIDYQFFETTSSDNSRGGGRRRHHHRY